jgi:hypothetical protein
MLTLIAVQASSISCTLESQSYKPYYFSTASWGESGLPIGLTLGPYLPEDDINTAREQDCERWAASQFSQPSPASFDSLTRELEQRSNKKT